jgi:hypothetical protein
MRDFVADREPSGGAVRRYETRSNPDEIGRLQ